MWVISATKCHVNLRQAGTTAMYMLAKYILLAAILTFIINTMTGMKHLEMELYELDVLFVNTN